MFNEMMTTAKEILKSMTDAQMIANGDFDRFMVNFLITDGEMTICADAIDDYFIVNDGDHEMRMPFPYGKKERMKIYNLGWQFAKKHTYTVGLNA